MEAIVLPRCLRPYKIKAPNAAASQSSKRPLPMTHQFVAGGITGIIEILALYPLDVVKTRFQLQTAQSPKHYSSVTDCFRLIVKDEGFFRLYRGILPPLIMQAPKTAIKFSSNEGYGTFYSKYNISGPFLPVLTGISAGCTEAFIVVPFELVKIRLQDKDSSTKYLNTKDCIIKIAKNEGIFAFMKGMESTLWRNGVWCGIYFGCISNIKSTSFIETTLVEQFAVNDVEINFLSGAIGGTLGTIGNAPFDVIKTRIQNNAYSGYALPGIVNIGRSEGYSALWKGFVPRVMRYGPGGGVMLVMFDYISDCMRSNILQ